MLEQVTGKKFIVNETENVLLPDHELRQYIEVWFYFKKIK